MTVTKQDMDNWFKHTYTKGFLGDNGDIVLVEGMYNDSGTYWRLTVNGDQGEVCSYYSGVYMHKGWCYATEYWKGTFPVEVPFRTLSSIAIATATKNESEKVK